MNFTTFIYQYSFYFFIYSFIGWSIEVCYAAIVHRMFVNRGFLNIPICPIYGVAIAVIVPILTRFNESAILLFIASTIMATLVELVVGFLLEKLFKQRWWDYTGEFGNIGGYICVKFSFLWGLACTVVLMFIHPLFELLVTHIPHFVGIPILIVLYALLFVDIGITIANVINFNAKLHQIDEIAASINSLSENIGKQISDKTIAVMDLKEKYDELLTESRKKYKRLISAFPTMKSVKHHNALKELRRFINKYNRKQK